MVGVSGVQAAFVLVAHVEADLQFQERMLKVFSERLRDREVRGSQFALLTDKVLRAQGKLLISMVNYTCEMHAIYGP